MSVNETSLTNTIRIDLKKALKRAAHKNAVGQISVEQHPFNLANSSRTPGQDLFFELFESVYDAVLITNLAGQLIRMNERAADFFSIREEDATDYKITDLISGADENAVDWILEHLKNERRVFIECFCLSLDGSDFPAEVTVNLIHLTEDNELCFFIRNVTVRKETEEELHRAQEGLLQAAHKAGMAEIATGILHDVGNLLNSVNVSCGLLHSALETKAVDGLQKCNTMFQEHLNDLPAFFANDPRGRKLPQLYVKIGEVLHQEWMHVARENERIQRTVDVIREVIGTQQDNARLSLFEQDIDVGEVINEVLALQQTYITDAHVKIDKDFDPGLQLKTQKAKLIFVMVNLIRNAVDAVRSTEEEKRLIQIRAFVNDTATFVQVEDNGIGIPPDNMAKIFTHGFTTKPSGHGFGLHACANFMKEMRGSIGADSPGEGQGTVFQLKFPKQPEQADNPDA